jgi:kinesin family member 1
MRHIYLDGITVGVFSPKQTPHLINLNEDPTLSECLLYYIKDGVTKLGTSEAELAQDIQLSGSHILKEHCEFQNDNGVVSVIVKPEALVYINGRKIVEPEILTTGSRVILGKNHVFRFQHPQQAREKRERKVLENPDEQVVDSESDEVVDWNFAQIELLEKQGIDLKAEMKKRLVALEAQFKREKEEADQQFEEQRKTYEARIDALQKQVEEQSMTMSMYSNMTSATDMDFSLARILDDGFDDEENSIYENPLCESWTNRQLDLASWVFKKWKNHQFTSIRDGLWGNAIFLKEANAISVELKKNVQFQFTLLSDTLYTPLPNELKDKSNGSSVRTVVAVEVNDQKNGAIHYWSLAKLQQRLELMRELYHSDGESYDYNVESLIGYDPFYDRFPWFRVIGRSFVYLSNLLYPIPLVQKVAIVNEAGDVKGYLRVAVQAVFDNDGHIINNHVNNGNINVNNNNVVAVNQLARVVFSDGTKYSYDERVIEENGNEAEDGKVIPQDDDTIGEHLKVGNEFKFRIIVLQAYDVPVEYTDIFCQFNFLHCGTGEEETFSTEPIKNKQDKPIGFYHIQNLTVKITHKFIEYIKSQPISFKIYGHYNGNVSKNTIKQVVRAPPKRLQQLPSITMSQPIRSTKFTQFAMSPTSERKPTTTAPSTATTIFTKHDILVWFEICELAPNGEYLPVPVDQLTGSFLLHQGIQRRIRITTVHEPTVELKWKDIREVIVGRIRNTPESFDEFDDAGALSLGIFPGELLEVRNDDRTFYQFEAAWDSSLHNSNLLNRVTQNGETIYVTLSSYLEVSLINFNNFHYRSSSR